jgi:hypothetical protein
LDYESNLGPKLSSLDLAHLVLQRYSSNKTNLNVPAGEEFLMQNEADMIQQFNDYLDVTSNPHNLDVTSNYNNIINTAAYIVSRNGSDHPTSQQTNKWQDRIKSVATDLSR